MVGTQFEKVLPLFRQRLEAIIPGAKKLEGSLNKYAKDDKLISVAPVKGPRRMQVCRSGGASTHCFYRHHAQAKRKAYEEESEGWSLSYSAKLTDVVRGMVMCGNAEDLLDVYHAVMKEFNVVEGRGRVKMNFREENKKKPPDV